MDMSEMYQPSNENMISIGIIYSDDKSLKCHYLSTLDEPTHFIQIPKDCSLILLQKILTKKLENCVFDETSKDSFCLYLKFKCVKALFQHECNEDPRELYKNTLMANQSNNDIKISDIDNKWIEIPDDYIKTQHSITNNPHFNFNILNDFLLIKKREICFYNNSIIQISDINIGAIVDAMDQQNRWYQAIVINKCFERIYLHFIGWSSKWNEWVSNTSRLSPRFTYTNGPHSKNSINNAVNYNEFQQMQNENCIIEQCEITKSFTFQTMFNLDFSSLKNELNHRDIVFTTSDSINNILLKFIVVF
eukprot:237068_1